MPNDAEQHATTSQSIDNTKGLDLLQMLICHRRRFIQIGLGALAGSVLPLKAIAGTLDLIDAPRDLALYNIHTNEKIEVCYHARGDYRPKALNEINHILRDHRSDTISPIDTELLDLLYAIKCRVHQKGPFEVISGYRSPATNEMLRRNTDGVAKTSFHTKGQAIDIRLPGYSTKRLRNLCVQMKYGGVGYYPKSDFVHLDTGPVRSW